MTKGKPANDACITDIHFVDADKVQCERMKAEQPQWAKYMCIENGFSVMALHGDRAVGVIAVKWQELPAPLPPTREGYINIIEVVRAYRRKGIARRLIELSLAKCRAEGVTQMRTWSTNDKTDAIPMWKALGFALCPVTHSMWRTEVTGYFVAKRVD